VEFFKEKASKETVLEEKELELRREEQESMAKRKKKYKQQESLISNMVKQQQPHIK